VKKCFGEGKVFVKERNVLVKGYFGGPGLLGGLPSPGFIRPG
jgi:hypothetical protein